MQDRSWSSRGDDKCKICEAGAIGRKWSYDVLMGRRSVAEMARYFGVTDEEVWRHIDEHIDMEEIQEEQKRQDGADRIVQQLERIIDVLSEKVEELSEGWVLDSQKILDLTRLAKELRGALMDYAEVIGEIQRGQIVVQVQQMEERVDQLVEILMDEVCDECREKVLMRLEQLESEVM